MNYKNTLQEFLQKQRLPLPKYNTIRTGGSDHMPLWISNIQVNGKIFQGNPYSTKVDAENSVAQICYDHIISDSNPNITNINLPNQEQYEVKQKSRSIYDVNISGYDKIILIDADNCDVDINADNYSTILFLFFCAKNTTKKLCFKLQHKYDNCYVFISESVGRDATDHLLTFVAGIIDCTNRISKINPIHYVLTKDHFGEYLEKFMTNTSFICSIKEAL